MECDICGRASGSGVRFHCPTCARNRLYMLRAEHLAVLLDKEDMGRRVEAAVKGHSEKLPRETLSRSGRIIDTHDCAKSSEMDSIISQSASLAERIDTITERAQALRDEMEQYKTAIKAKKASLQQRRSDAESATFGLAERDAKDLESIEASIRRTRRRWEMKHHEIVDGRAALCRPAARLAGLRRHRRPREDGSMREYYTIGCGIPIFDLRELHTAKQDELSASLTQLAYLTARTANYLALRLPAEITLPHKDYPLPTIFPPQSSYQSREVPFPGSTPSGSSSNSPVASRTLDTRSLPTPRPLFLRMPLSKLAKDDTRQYAYFIEGVTLLAWDIAWLCKSQGMSGFDSEWDICAVGRNLWNLLLGEKSSTTEATAKDSGNKLPPDNYPTRFGEFSHGTAHSFFGSAEGKNVMKDWRLQSPMRAIVKVREFVNNELQKAEWEVLHEAEWDVEAGMDEAVLVGGRERFDQEQKASTKSAQAKSKSPPPESDSKNNNSVRPVGRPITNDNPHGAPASGTSGWMKLRTRLSEQQK
ncbi:uncharacterized protein PV09_01857 [Verruconis gallopava]|uniref:Autophagy-related protein 14 n=1 Tax=Verruconis gallopava TaxID=253628 RepID=A0A0D1XYV5_9PEZI|nr:uncharacterized protein PV09_01857 [Verruconis gallopava]KIW07956.1 hypothetical protein PV09_01857 [Verruconis gallopava]